MHFGNLLEPWVLLRLAAGFVVVLLFGRAAHVSWPVLRYFDVTRTTEGQLALERHAELAATFTRVATAVQIALLALTMLAGDRLSGSIRGAMCGFGVFHASPWGFRSLAATAITAVAAGVVSRLHALDAKVRSFDLIGPLSTATLLLAACAAIDFGLAIAFTLDLDLSVVASCCSVQLDSVARGDTSPLALGASARALSCVGTFILLGASIALGWRASRNPRAPAVIAAAVTSVAALPFAVGATVLEVAPYAFELPHHVCPFCLLRPSVLFIGYPIFGAILVAVTSMLAAGIGAIIARTDPSRAAARTFARASLRRGTLAWTTAMVIGALPLARYALLTGGLSLFR